MPLETPQHNEVFKRKHYTLLDMIQSMMSYVDLPPSF
jgi:hypothetical protein